MTGPRLPLLPTGGEALYQKDRVSEAPVTRASVALFRFGERCNNACPMCSNSGREAAWDIATDELLRRADRLADLGFGGAYVTGGEPTIHPGFFSVVERLRARGLAWHLNSHGRSFSDGGFADRAVALGLGRAIISLHSHVPEVSAAIFGASERAHSQTIAGIENLIARRADVLVNAVLTRGSLDGVAGWVRFCAERFPGATLKLAFPSHFGKGGDWPGIDLSLDEARAPLAAARDAAADVDATLLFESVPACVLGDAKAVSHGRSACGESHYLEDLRGHDVFPMEFIEAELSRYAAGCLRCRAFASCPGVSALYAERRGTGELVPLG